MDSHVDHVRVEREFSHLLDREDCGSITEPAPDMAMGGENGSFAPHDGSPRGDPEPVLGVGVPSRLGRFVEEEEELEQEDMPVTVVIKADSANTLASLVDALRDCRDLELEDGDADQGTPDEGKSERGWRPRQRLVVSLARARVGAVTSSDIQLARDCESPVFAHNVAPDSTALKALRQRGSGVVAAAPEGDTTHPRSAAWAGGEVVVSETVGELLGEIERFVVSAR